MMENVVVRDGVAGIDFEKVIKMLSNAFWSLDIKIAEVKKGAQNSALVVGAFLPNQTQVGYARVIYDKTRFDYNKIYRAIGLFYSDKLELGICNSAKQSM